MGHVVPVPYGPVSMGAGQRRIAGTVDLGLGAGGGSGRVGAGRSCHRLLHPGTCVTCYCVLYDPASFPCLPQRREEFTNYVFLERAQMAGESSAENWRLFPQVWGGGVGCRSGGA